MQFIENIEKLTQENDDYRRVIYTTPHQQLVVMSIEPLDEIGLESHNGHDQFFRVEKGNGIAIIGNKVHMITDGTALVIPDGTEHNIINNSKTKKLKLYTIYSPPQHKPGTITHRKRGGEAPPIPPSGVYSPF